MTESELTKEFNDFFGLEREKHIEISALECKNFARHMMQKERGRCAAMCDEISVAAWKKWDALHDKIKKGIEWGAGECAEKIRLQ